MVPTFIDVMEQLPHTLNEFIHFNVTFLTAGIQAFRPKLITQIGTKSGVFEQKAKHKLFGRRWSKPGHKSERLNESKVGQESKIQSNSSQFIYLFMVYLVGIKNVIHMI